MPFLTEADIETALLAELSALGDRTTAEAEIRPDGNAAERTVDAVL